jgi:cell division transport system permease protein
MTLLQALRDFAREALVGLLRSLRVSALAVVTIGVSLFLAGAFYLVSRNLETTVRRWRDEARFVVYLDPATGAARLDELAHRLRRAPWISDVAVVTRDEAERRFERSFPSLSDLVRGGASASLPASLEARLRPLAEGQHEAFRIWVRELLQLEGVELVDDDRDWIGQIETVAAVVRALGLVLTAILIAASVFTIASVVRLTSYLYRDEIAVMRLVGATEFYIRGPFYFEGLFQGLLGSLVALGALTAVHVAVRPKLGGSLVASALAQRFLSGPEIAGLLGLGALAGLVGAVLSLGREQAASERA